MAIKMRVSKDSGATCASCGASIDQSLDVFDVKIGNEMLSVCDECMDVLLHKSLDAVCYTNHRVKQPYEIKKKNARSRRRRLEGRQA